MTSNQLAAEANRAGKFGVKRLLQFREASILIIVLIIVAILSALSPAFLTSSNLSAVLKGMAVEGIIAAGMTVALISGGFDLSVGSQLALASVVLAKAYTSGVNIWVAALAGVAAAVLCGIFNGFCIGKIGINSLIITLASMSIARGICMVMTKGSPITFTALPEGFKSMGSGDIAGIPILVLIFLVIVLIMDFMTRKSAGIRKVFCVGSNEKSARLSGIHVARVKMGVYVLVSVLVGIAGVVNTARFSVAAPNTGIGVEMTAISAAVIGGVRLNGGEGSVFGSILGVILLNLISNGLVLMRVSVYWQQLISGIILIIAVLIDYLSSQKKTAR